MFHQEFGERDNYFFAKLGGFFEMRLSLSLANKSFLTLDCHQEALLPSSPSRCWEYSPRVANFERPVIPQHNQLEKALDGMGVARLKVSDGNNSVQTAGVSPLCSRSLRCCRSHPHKAEGCVPTNKENKKATTNQSK
jgi:hypothetical protein